MHLSNSLLIAMPVSADRLLMTMGIIDCRKVDRIEQVIKRKFLKMSENVIFQKPLN